MRAKRSLGQHFLKSERALNTIVEVGEITDDDTILEIGPGMGALTEKLLKFNAKIIAIEKDGRFFDFLKQKFEKEIWDNQLELIHGDIMAINNNLEAKLPSDRGYKIIANIPYNITGAILRKFLETRNQPERMILLLQKEVVERIIAKNGKESILSISVKAYGKPKYIETVKAGSFSPMPSVHSAIISIDNISKDFFMPRMRRHCLRISEGSFFELVKAGFRSKRKKLSSNLSSLYNQTEVKEAFVKLNLNENLRAEDTDIQTWQKLIRELKPR